MKTVNNWTAKRAGARITVIGESRTEDGVFPIRVVGVASIKPGSGCALATMDDGTQHRLSIPADQRELSATMEWGAAAMEWGFRAFEKGMNLEMARREFVRLQA